MRNLKKDRIGYFRKQLIDDLMYSVTLLNCLGLFSWNQEFSVVVVNLFGLQISDLPKLLSFGKFFMGGFLHISIIKINVCIFVLCIRFVKNTRNLLNIYFLNVLMLYVFGVGFNRFFLLLISLIRRIFSLLLRVMVVLWLN